MGLFLVIYGDLMNFNGDFNGDLMGFTGNLMGFTIWLWLTVCELEHTHRDSGFTQL